MRLFVASLGAGALLLGLLAAAGPAASAAADSTVTVTPSTGLAGGDSVHVAATGVTPAVAVRVVQCDVFNGDPELDCPDLETTAADGTGNVSLDVTLSDPVLRSEPFGDPTPVYCRADGCHLFIVWYDDTGTQQVLASDALEFSGSPATIVATPSSGLRKHHRVAVTGTAFGAEGHSIRIVEEACFSIVQGSGCYGALPVVTSTVRSDGTYAVHYRAQRFLSDGTDCTGDILGFCELSVVVLGSDGNPDDSFGVAARGQPAAPLTFRSR